jgi:Cu(I)/Ag(I) efflux system membrane fusion protein
MKKHIALLLIALLSLVATACNQHDATGKPDDVDYYTCTMHPSVRSQDPHGKCPICSMDLIPVKKKNLSAPTSDASDGTNDAVPGVFSVPIARLQQIGVTYAAIDKRPFRHTVRTVGKVAYDKQRNWDYVTRVEGYIKQLNVFSRGELVEKGAPLLTIYSPDLFTTQNEFVGLLKTRDEAQARQDRPILESTARLVDAARQRLRLWNISAEQIAALEKSRQPQETLTLYSPFRGVVQDLAVEQGRRVMPGDRLVEIADLSEIWVWADFFQDELPMLKTGLSVAISSSSYPGEVFDGKISVIDPFMNDTQRTGRVRLDVTNPDLKLRPEMYVDAALTMDMGIGVAVPVSAVLPTGLHNIVFIDKGEGHLQPRFIEIGRKYGDYYEVKGNLEESERVVTSANFLIDAEAKVQGALKAW